MFLATNLLAGAWLGHLARVLLLSLCHGHLRTGYIRLLYPVLGVTSYKVSIAYLSHIVNRVVIVNANYSNVSTDYCSLICGGRRESTRWRNNNF